LNDLLDKFGLRKKIIAHVKNEGSNLNAMNLFLKFVVNCETLSLQESFNGICFGHVFSKTCQYATTNEKVCKNIRYVFIKPT
jgi:hypothetical protein